MPIYEFRCGACGERFEELVAMDTPTASCPSCDAEGAERLISQPSAQAKFSGTPSQNRRREEKRRISLDGRRNEFKQGRQKARDAQARKREGGKHE